MHDSLWQVAVISLAFSLIAVVVFCAALVGAVLYGLGKVLKQNEDYANRQMAGDWPSYAGFMKAQLNWTTPITYRGTTPPPVEPLSAEDPVPEEGETVGKF